MECLYSKCTHSSTNSFCSFRKFPTTDCDAKIWKKYAGVLQRKLKKVINPVLCSCHFTSESQNPLPCFEWTLKRGHTANATLLEPREKYSRTNNEEYIESAQDLAEERSGNETDWSIFEDECAIGTSQLQNYNNLDDFDDIDSRILQQENDIYEIDWNVFENEPVIRAVRDKLENYTIEVVDSISIEETINLAEIFQHRSQIDQMNALRQENAKMKAQIGELEKDLAAMNGSFGSFDFKFIEHSDQKIFAHTEMPSKAVFDIVLHTLSKLEFQYVSGWKVTKISMRNQLLMTLMKLRMDLRHYDLAERFRCSEATVSNVVRTWILSMHEIFFVQLMKDIPARSKNKDSMPAAFKEFLDCRIILDCTEMFTDKPWKMYRQKELYSQYKHHVTFKPLVGAAPNGVATYASRFYPGSVSDKKIVQHCGINDKFHSGDLLLADKGFTIKDILPNGVDVNTPPFLTTPQFTREQVRRTELIAKARVHIERLINKVKNFKLLKYIPAEMFHIASEVFQVCVALTNFQNPLIREVAMKL